MVINKIHKQTTFDNNYLEFHLNNIITRLIHTVNTNGIKNIIRGNNNNNNAKGRERGVCDSIDFTKQFMDTLSNCYCIKLVSERISGIMFLFSYVVDFFLV